jgi:hypothetical protein
MSVSCGCCVLLGRGLCDELISSPEDSHRLWCVVECDLETSWVWKPNPRRGAAPQEQNIYHQAHCRKHENKQTLNMVRQKTSTSALLQLTLHLQIVYLMYFECNNVIRWRFPTSRYLVSVYVHVLVKWAWLWPIHEVETSCNTIKDRKDCVVCDWKYRYTLLTGILLLESMLQ